MGIALREASQASVTAAISASTAGVGWEYSSTVMPLRRARLMAERAFGAAAAERPGGEVDEGFLADLGGVPAEVGGGLADAGAGADEGEAPAARAAELGEAGEEVGEAGVIADGVAAGDGGLAVDFEGDEAVDVGGFKVTPAVVLGEEREAVPGVLVDETEAALSG